MVPRFKFPPIVLGAVTSVVSFGGAWAAPPEPPQASDSSWVLQLASGYGAGMAANSGIRKAEYRTGLEYRFTPSFSLLAELASVRFEGSRGGRDASTWGLTLIPLARWSFLRRSWGRLSFEFGLGGSLFRENFPPSGTHLNGYSTFGISAEVTLRRRTSLNLGLRELHHSNGRGFVSSNPAYDGISVHMGTSLEF